MLACESFRQAATSRDKLRVDADESFDELYN